MKLTKEMEEQYGDLLEQASIDFWDHMAEVLHREMSDLITEIAENRGIELPDGHASELAEHLNYTCEVDNIPLSDESEEEPGDESEE